MKFKFNTGFAGVRHVINPGDVMEVTTKEAKRLSERGFGQVERAVAAPATVPANKPKPPSKRKPARKRTPAAKRKKTAAKQAPKAPAKTGDNSK